MTYAFGVVIFAVGILVSVCLHEAGHLLTAKRFGMKATQYFAGFGPTLWSFRRGETEYGVKAIPAGGFVKIIGMTPLEDVPPADDDRAFWRYPIWQRTVVLVAGSATHFLLAIVIFYFAAITTGLPNPVAASFEPTDAKPAIGEVTACVVQQYEFVNGDLRDCKATDPAGLVQVRPAHGAVSFTVGRARNCPTMPAATPGPAAASAASMPAAASACSTRAKKSSSRSGWSNRSSSSSGVPSAWSRPLVDDRHPRAELLDLVHRVGREDDRLALVAQLGDLLRAPRARPGRRGPRSARRRSGRAGRGRSSGRSRPSASSRSTSSSPARRGSRSSGASRRSSPSARGAGRGASRRAGRSIRPAPRPSSGRRCPVLADM